MLYGTLFCVILDRFLFPYPLNFHNYPMAYRIEVIKQLKEQAQQKGIFLPKDGLGKTQRNVLIAETNLEKALRERLKYYHSSTFGLWVLGGSRYDKDTPEYDFTEHLMYALSSRLPKMNLITGAGPGIMGAAQEGFERAKKEALLDGKVFTGQDMGVTIPFPWPEGKPQMDYYAEHTELSERVRELLDLSHASYVGPGAVGTAYELWTLIQLKQLNHLEGDYTFIVHPEWKEELEIERNRWYDQRKDKGQRPTINDNDMQIIYSDNIPEIVGVMARSYNKWHEEIGKHVRRRRFDFPVFQRLKKSNSVVQQAA